VKNDYRGLGREWAGRAIKNILPTEVTFFFFSLALQPPWALTSDFQFHDHFADGRTP
jgi:hypothetical protein